MDGATLEPEGFNVIARLPGVDVLRGQLVGVAASPITGLVRGLGSMMSGLAVALGQIAEQGLVAGEAPAEEPAAEAEEPAPPAEHAEEEAQPTEEETVPADEPPADAEQAADADAPETSEDESEQDGEPSSDESEDTD